MAVKVDSKVAAKVMKSAGYEPLEPYKNSKHPWKCKHLECGETITPTYNQIQQGWRGCKHCSGKYIFQIDADELPNVDLLDMLPGILEANPEVDVYLVPRINTVSGITEEHIQEWRWRVEGDRINFPDYQWRIYKNIPTIKWVNKVHERLDGFKIYSTLPAQDEFCLLHPKTIERQEKQNEFYNTL
jgi:glycosyltransferase involved in cell wall biosynthesis